MHDKDLTGISAVGRPLVLAIGAMVGFLTFLSSTMATLLGGFTHVYRTPPDDHIESVNNELGLKVPLLTTPLNYLSEDNSDGT